MGVCIGCALGKREYWKLEQKLSYTTGRLYVNADFDTIEKPSPTGKRLKRAQKQGSRGQSLTSEALFCYVEGCSLPLW
jgi:hypothetical protein